MSNKIVSLKNREFTTVYQQGRSKANKYLVMYVMKNSAQGRVGISVSKKVGNSVVRHRIKRLIKEAYRLNQKNIRSDVDIIVIARTSAKEKKYQEIESALLHLLKLHNIVL